MMNHTARSQLANRVSIVTIVVNLLLSVFKGIAGIVAGSAAMVSDSIHSASDVLSTGIVMVGVNLSKKNQDSDHPYGHEKLESIASVILALILLLTALVIAVSGVKNIQDAIRGNQLAPPTVLALIAAVCSIGVKEWMYHYTKRAARKVNSSALMADAWHHRSDAISSIGSLIGIGGAMLGITVLDPIASIVIAFLIGKVAVSIGITAVNEVTDHAADVATQQLLHHAIMETPGVLRVDDLRTRIHGSKLCVDTDIAADGDISLHKAHDIAEAVSRNVCAGFSNVKTCMVHVNPYSE